MAESKVSSSKKILLASILIGVLIFGGVVSLVLVLAAQNQSVSSSIQATYQATEVSGNIAFAFGLRLVAPLILLQWLRLQRGQCQQLRQPL